MAGAVSSAPVVGGPASGVPAPSCRSQPRPRPVSEVPPANLPPGVTRTPPAAAESVPVDTKPAHRTRPAPSAPATNPVPVAPKPAAPAPEPGPQ